MKFTEIDGKRYEVGACGECPFRDMGDGGYAAHCTHPNAEPYMDDMLWIDEDGISIPDGCPLREVPEHKPCPFCGSIKLRIVYIDDTGEELEQWMMEEANKESESEGREGYESWQEFVDVNALYYNIHCNICGAIMTSQCEKDAWAKWDRRVDPKEESQ